jgi:hypothetical protein
MIFLDANDWTKLYHENKEVSPVNGFSCFAVISANLSGDLPGQLARLYSLSVTG